MRTHIDTRIPKLERAPELAALAILDSALEIAEDALLATDRDVVLGGRDDYADRSYVEPPQLHIARAILEQAAALRTSLHAYGKAAAVPPARLRAASLDLGEIPF